MLNSTDEVNFQPMRYQMIFDCISGIRSYWNYQLLLQGGMKYTARYMTKSVDQINDAIEAQFPVSGFFVSQL